MAPANSQRPRSETKLDIGFLFACGALFTLVAAGSFVPELRLWGVDHLSYYSPPLRLAVLFAAALTFLPGVGEWIYKRWTSILEGVTASPLRSRVFAGVIILSALWLFIGLQASTELLGDGQLQSKLLVRMAGSGDVTFGHFARTVLDGSMAPGTNLLVYTIVKLTGAGDPASAWRLLNALIGAVFVLAAFGITYKSRGRIEFRSVLFATLLVSGGIQLFFGYIETYAPMVVLTTLYVATAFETIRGRRNVLIPIALFAAAVLFHYQALLLGPSLLFVLASRVSAFRKPSRRRILTAAIGGTTVLAVLISSRITEWDGFFLPLYGAENTPGILTPSHIADIANEMFLIVPILPLLVATALSGRFARTRATAEPGDATLAFAITIHVPCMVFLFGFLPELGMARDWDLFVIPAFGMAIPLVVTARNAFEHPDVRSCVTRYLAPAVATALLIVIPWVGINANETRSVHRYETLLGFANTDAGYGYEILAMHFEDRGDFAMKAMAYDKAYAVSGNPRHLVSACSARLRSGEVGRAVATLETYLDANPKYDLARDVYIEALVRIGDMAEVIRVCSDGIEVNPNRPYFHYYLGIAYREQGFSDKAAKAFDDCRRLDPPTIMVDAMDKMENPPPAVEQ